MSVSKRSVSLFSAFVLSLTAIALHSQQKQDPRAQEIVRLAVKVELAADRADHSRWQYRDINHKPRSEERRVGKECQ